MKYNNFAQETNRMVELMKYGVNENTPKSSVPRVEYSIKAADGKTYGIVNEGTKFYIKVAPPKDTEILNEDFDYIGGEMNKKQNEYKSYNAASKNLELKLMQINESHKENKVCVETFKSEPAAEWQINETKEMRSAINRMNQISRNMGYILTEGSIPSEHTLPEAPAKNPSQDKVNAPFTDTAVANGEKEFTETETNHEKPNGSTYSEKARVKMDSDKKPKSVGQDGYVYTDGAKYTPKDAVANEHPSGGKVTRADESKRTIKLTEEQVLAWGYNDDHMERSNGTHIGSSKPFEDEVSAKEANQGNAAEPIHEDDNAVHSSDTKLYPNGGTGEVEHKGKPFTEHGKSDAEAQNGVIAESDFDDEEIAGFDEYDDEDLPFPEVEDEYELELDDDAKDAAYDDMKSDGFIDDDEDEEDEELYEVELHDFGKHPSYRKSPMKLPPNKEVAPNGARDWNDESAEGEEPYGKKIGSSAPFEKAVKMITDSVMESLGF